VALEAFAGRRPRRVIPNAQVKRVVGVAELDIDVCTRRVSPRIRQCLWTMR
jgi:hypothetical protein